MSDTVQPRFNIRRWGWTVFSVGSFVLLSALMMEGLALADASRSDTEIDARLAGQVYYRVRRGDSLGRIAQWFYKDKTRWRDLYEANRDVIGSPHELEVGWVLIIPQLNVSQSETVAIASAPEKQALRLAASHAASPLVDTGLPQGGLLTELVQAVLNTMETEAEVELQPIPAALQAVQDGEVNGLFPYPKGMPQADQFFVSRPLYRVLVRVFVRNGSAITFENVDDLVGLTVCQTEGFVTRKLRPLVEDKRLDLQTRPTMAACFHALAEEQVDVVAVHELGGQSTLQQLGLSERVCMFDRAVAIETLHLMFPKVQSQSRILAYEFDQALARLEQAEAVQQITSRHLYQYYQALETPPLSCPPATEQVPEAPSPPMASQSSDATSDATVAAPADITGAVPEKVSPVETEPVQPSVLALEPVTPTLPRPRRREAAAVVPLSMPRTHADEFRRIVDPDRPPRRLELVSIPVQQRPEIDGRGDERSWQTAPSITTLEAASQRPITLQSVHTQDEIFFLVSYPDPSPSETHRTWGWDPQAEVYKPMRDREDTFVFKWSMVGNQVNLALSGAEPHRADIWTWRALRTNPAGYADDSMHLLLPVPHDEATVVKSPIYGELYLRQIADVGRSAFEERLFQEYQADYLPRYYPREPEESRADVRARGVWHANTWTLEFARKLRTDHDDDLSFTPGEVYLFAVGCYQMLNGAVEPQLTQPLYNSGDAFDRLLLRIAWADEG